MKEKKTSLTHVDEHGKARMVDVSSKPIQSRSATAGGFIMLQPATVEMIRENRVKKGDVLAIAEIAGIQAAKDTSRLIPLCHPLRITWVGVTAVLQDDGVYVEATARCEGQTGIEMEALTAVSAALLTVYDMCKAVDNAMSIGNITLLSKEKE